MEKTATNPNDYIASLPADKHDDLKKLDELISKIFKNHSRVMWEGVFWGGSQQKIIGYGDLTYTRSDKKKVEWFVVGLTLQKNYISLFVSGKRDDKYLVEHYHGKLGKAKTGKSSIAFSKLSDLEMPALKKLLQEAEEIASSSKNQD